MGFSFTKGFENYAKFPMHYLRVTQSYNAGNHKAHWDGANYKDYPIDLGGMDSGRDYLFAPVDMKIVKINGIEDKVVSNKIFLESVKEVQTVKYGKTKIFMTAVHFEDSDISKFGLKEGKIIKAGEKICLEGKETASANHLHFTCGIGSAKSSIENNKDKWVTKGDCKKPEEIFFVDPKFTKVLNKGGLSWTNLPNESIKEETENQPTTNEKKYPFDTTLKKGTALYTLNGSKFPNSCSRDRKVTVQGEKNGRYEVYGETFNPHIVYVDKSAIDKDSTVKFPFEAVIKKGTALYDKNNKKYPNSASKDRKVKVQVEKNGRYEVYGETFNPHIVYVNKSDIK